VRAEARRQPVHDDLDDAAEGVALLAGGVHLGDHRVRGGLVEGADRAGVDEVEVVRTGQHAVGRVHRAEGDHVADHLDTEHLAQERPRHGAERGPGRGFPCAGAFEHRTGVGEAVLEHAGQVGVAGSGPGQRGVARAFLCQRVGFDGVGGHHRFPLGPFGVADLDGDRAAQRAAVPDPRQHGDLVLLELHPRTAAVAEASTGQLGGDVGRGDVDIGDEALQHGHQGGAV
jgi:hypothetical protein